MPLDDQILLVTGAARSGKSEWAEALAHRSGQGVTYIATATVDPADGEWGRRVARHRDRRPPHWHLQEVPLALPAAIAAAAADTCLLVDSLGTWLANLLDQDEGQWQTTAEALVASLRQTPARVIVVSEETGWGVVPAYPTGRLFRDRLGQITRQVGTVADAVYLVVAGYAVDIKALGQGVKERTGEPYEP